MYVGQAEEGPAALLSVRRHGRLEALEIVLLLLGRHQPASTINHSTTRATATRYLVSTGPLPT